LIFDEVKCRIVIIDGQADSRTFSRTALGQRYDEFEVLTRADRCYLEDVRVLRTAWHKYAEESEMAVFTRDGSIERYPWIKLARLETAVDHAILYRQPFFTLSFVESLKLGSFYTSYEGESNLVRAVG
jgi:hypothetical protein